MEAVWSDSDVDQSDAEHTETEDVEWSASEADDGNVVDNEAEHTETEEVSGPREPRHACHF